jgi:hypothetical protein
MTAPVKFDAREPCKSCPYHTDAPLELWSPLEFRQLLAHERSRMGVVYGCHKYRNRKDEAQVCVGWLLDQKRRNIPSISLRLTLMRNPGAVACLNEASSPVELFDSVEEMCEANGVEP